jgi:transcriptional regulator with XRE-family HTH domain
MTFGERISALRKKLKWSQDELAKKVGTSAPIIGRYERNEIKPSIETAKNIADVMGVTLDYLLGGNNAILDKELLKRLEDIESLTPEDKDKIYYFIDMAVRDAKTRQAYR